MWTLKLDYASCPQCFVCCVNMIVIPVFLSCYSVSCKKKKKKIKYKKKFKKKERKKSLSVFVIQLLFCYSAIRNVCVFVCIFPILCCVHFVWMLLCSFRKNVQSNFAHFMKKGNFTFFLVYTFCYSIFWNNFFSLLCNILLFGTVLLYLK